MGRGGRKEARKEGFNAKTPRKEEKVAKGLAALPWLTLASWR